MNLKTQLSQLGHDALAVISRGKVIIIAILALILFGYALLQIDAAISKDAVTGADQEVPVLTPKKVNFDAETIDKINALSGEEADISKPTSSRTENPFDSE